MRKFLIKVDGRPYEVEVEEVSSFPQHHSMQASEAAPEATSKIPAPVVELPKPPVPQKSEAPVELPASGTKINAPMPGKIIAVKVGPGQAVKRGDVLMVLEAMKMENEIQAPVAGTVTAIGVSEGVNVKAGAMLACIA